MIHLAMEKWCWFPVTWEVVSVVFTSDCEVDLLLSSKTSSNEGWTMGIRVTVADAVVTMVSLSASNVALPANTTFHRGSNSRCGWGWLFWCNCCYYNSDTVLADGKAVTSVEAGKPEGVADTAGNIFTEPEVGAESVIMLGVVSSWQW